MSLLAALTLDPDLDLTMIPASSMSCRPELLKHRLPHAGHCEPLAGPVDEGFALNLELSRLTGDGFSDWMMERTDLATLLSVSEEPSLFSLPSPPAPDLEAMTSLLKKEWEQTEDYFLEESLSPEQVAPSTSPSDRNLHFPFADGFQPQDHPCTPAPLQTLDSSCLELLDLYGRDAPTELPLQGSEVPVLVEEPLAPAPKGDRRQKKRDQNKTAALRYRQRKRAEHDALGDECQLLEARNRDLREKAESIEREIQYVKDLLIEVYKARSQRLRITPEMQGSVP
nr:cyclic AMP-dependent transcription factor ATF-5 [Anolis sagrei ordinatus]